MDSLSSVGGRRRAVTKHYSAEDQALDQIAREAEARLAARRQARAEAREIRMRELERQQKEAEENADRVYDMYSDPVGRPGHRVSTPSGRTSSVGIGNSSVGVTSVTVASPSYLSSRRSSEDSVDEGGSLGANTSLRDMRHELKELEEKFRKSMIQNAQLDNEKSSLTYQVELLKDQIEEIEEMHWQLQKEHKDKCREFDQLKRSSVKLKEDMDFYKAQLEERDMLIQQHGLVIVADNDVASDDDDEDDLGENENGRCKKKEKGKPRKVLVSVESAQMLQDAGEGSLDVRLRRFAEERNELQDQVRHLKLEIEEVQSRHGKKSVGSISTSGQGGGSVHPVISSSGATLNGPELDVLDLQREANKQLADYKFKLQKAEQDVSTLQANVARLESQVIRYKSAAEAAEKVEGELKSEKRKLQRELREAQTRLEELETSNTHLQRRLDKLKSAKSALLKDL
ncbi:leucine-rich repeat flightless-interacting protein 2 isoform X3 [Ischnura elegans]|uniref:leucine-rich repeat flightless-interacting protein 2 isoform X3 n=1 Tax=Ischnura elegans TaxID=197161 RepID=UPI001ED88DD4|nr:leucine-rich repeat flightless-interacting protein 2 isoform X3 [Ischnura elegans]